MSLRYAWNLSAWSSGSDAAPASPIVDPRPGLVPGRVLVELDHVHRARPVIAAVAPLGLGQVGCSPTA